MDVREKLIDLLTGHSIDTQQDVEYVADHLIANGVTVQENVEISDELLKQLKNAPITICKEEPSIELMQEWISVDDRLPEMGEHYQSEDVLVCIDYRPDDPDTTKDSYVSIDHVDFNCFGQGWFSCERDDPRDGEPSPYFVTHWMPMPLVESTGLICHSRRKENDNETD